MNWINANEKFPEIVRTLEDLGETNVYKMGDTHDYFAEYSKEVLVRVDGKIVGYGNLYREYEDNKFYIYGIHLSLSDGDYGFDKAKTVEWCYVE